MGGDDEPRSRSALRDAGTSPAAIRHHYDLSDDFFGIWLGPDLVYSCALVGTPRTATLHVAQQRKLDYFANRLAVGGGRLLDVGCGWGALLERCVREHGAAGGVGLTLSPAQQAFAERRERARRQLPASRAGSTTSRTSRTTRSRRSSPPSTSPQTHSTPTRKSTSTARSSTAPPRGCDRAAGSGCS